MKEVDVVGMVESLECPFEGFPVSDGAGDEVGEAWRERDGGGRNGSELMLDKEGSGRSGEGMQIEERDDGLR